MERAITSGRPGDSKVATGLRSAHAAAAGHAPSSTIQVSETLDLSAAAELRCACGAVYSEHGEGGCLRSGCDLSLSFLLSVLEPQSLFCDLCGETFPSLGQERCGPCSEDPARVVFHRPVPQFVRGM